MAWTDERVERLKELWAQGLSASQIARELGGVTRNAVIGKVHRLGLASRAATASGGGSGAAVEAGGEEKGAKSAAQEEAAPAEASAAPEAASAAPARAEIAVRDPSQPREPGPPTPEEAAARETLAEIEKLARRIPLMELTERTCKWPIGDPTHDDFAFCGLPSVPGKPYCEHHVAVAYQPMSSRRDRSRAAR